MMNVQMLEKALCSTFCSSIRVNSVPFGYAVSTAFKDGAGDSLGFYVTVGEDGYRIEDSGDFLSRVIASGIDIENTNRGALLKNILHAGGAFWDVDTYEIKTPHFNEKDLPKRMIDFLSSLIRARDIELVTREVVRSTFKEDAIAAIQAKYSDVADFNENKPINEYFAEFPSDLNIIPKIGQKSAAVFFATNDNKLDQALLLQQAAQLKHCKNFVIVAMIEKMQVLSERKFQRVVNRPIITPIFRGDEENAITRIGEEIGLGKIAA